LGGFEKVVKGLEASIVPVVWMSRQSIGLAVPEAFRDGHFKRMLIIRIAGSASGLKAFFNPFPPPYFVSLEPYAILLCAS
jgi:hypothetical protein